MEPASSATRVCPDPSQPIEIQLMIPGIAKPFHHTDRNTLTKIGEPTPNPLAAAARKR